jgi:hypothetical protein
MSLLSLGFGAAGAAIGHFQNLWQFTRGRWEPSPGQGGGGDAPPRFFSVNLWGTIIQPDEIALLPSFLKNQVLKHSPFSQTIADNPLSLLHWDKWNSYKHLVYQIGCLVSNIANYSNPRDCANYSISLLEKAISLHSDIGSQGISLRDSTNLYQTHWRQAMVDLLDQKANDYDYLDLLS